MTAYTVPFAYAGDDAASDPSLRRQRMRPLRRSIA
jgi:hypothetical protein